MKNILVFGLFSLLCIPNLFAQNTCVNNLIHNGDLSEGIATKHDQDIDNATNFSRIWAGGSVADFYPAHLAGGYPPPLPTTGNYVGCWISNTNTSSATYREGFKFGLGRRILPQPGEFNLTFDMACLSGSGNSEVAIYGVFNPSGAPCNTPTGAHTPSNIDLYGSANTILLGTISLGNSCSYTKVNQHVRLKTDAAGFPVNGITHIFITSSDRSNLSGAHYMAFDNFCLDPVVCLNNFVVNGDLEDGTPTTQHQDINNANAFSPIWASSNWAGAGLADYYAGTVSPPGTNIPTPASGDYASCWISSSDDLRYREGFMTRLFHRINPNVGSFNFSFEMACLLGWGAAEVSVYGVYNPSGNPCAAPTGVNAPTNLNLFGAANTVLLGTVALNGNCSNTKTTQTFTLNTNNAGFPANGITHIFVTSSDDDAGLNGSHYMAFDNFCMNPIVPCLDIVNSSITCIGDMNRDGVPEYEIQFFANNSGRIDLSSNCGTVSPSSITVYTPGWHSVVVTSQWQSCYSINLATTHYNVQGVPCWSKMNNFIVPECPGFGEFGEFGREEGKGDVIGKESFIASPNPASSKLYLKWDTKEVPKKLSLSIFSTNGIEVQRIEGINGHEGYEEINIEKLKDGLYIIKAMGENYTPSPIKFVKKS